MRHINWYAIYGGEVAQNSVYAICELLSAERHLVRHLSVDFITNLFILKWDSLKKILVLSARLIGLP